MILWFSSGSSRTLSAPRRRRSYSALGSYTFLRHTDPEMGSLRFLADQTHCRLPRVNIQASTLAAISGHRRRDTMPEMAVSGAGPFRKRPDYGLDAKMRAKTDDASSNWCSQVGPQVLSPSPSLYRGPIVQLEADLGSMLIIWARAGALQTPLQPPKITLCTYCDLPSAAARHAIASL